MTRGRPEPMKLTLPLPVNLANSRLHWRPKLKAKKEYWEALDMRVLLGMIPKPPPEPMQRVTIGHTWYLHGKLMDQGNAYHRLKWIEDWLVGNGYLTDDDPENVTLLRPVQLVDRKNKRVEITITEVTA